MRTMERTRRAARRGRRGSALIPTLVVVSSLAIFALALITATLSGARTVNHQSDEYFLGSAVESLAILTAESMWSGYLAQPSQGGEPGSIDSFRTYLDGLGVTDAGPGGSPAPDDGADMIPLVGLPEVKNDPRLNNVNVDAMNVVRRDVNDSTQLWITVQASTNRGKGIVNPVLNRAVQQVYTVEPEDFDGFEYGLLANNVNCVFCHSQFDSVDRYYNQDPNGFGRFDRIKIGTLESLMLRHDMDGIDWYITDQDSDSFVAGSLYVRGAATDHHGSAIGNWANLTFKPFEFDAKGKIIQDIWGDMSVDSFAPAPQPLKPFENLYVDYPTDYGDMVDGSLPVAFPAPIPDNGGVDPSTGLKTNAGASNKLVDDSEFFAVAQKAEGAITAGIITTVGPGETVDTVAEYSYALTVGNTSSVQQSVGSNLILSGTKQNPITIDGTVAIDGDVIINGWVKGEGSLIVRGNIYIPTDLQYLDGKKYLSSDLPGAPTGPRTFGISQDGTKNALGLAAGGNIMIGDYSKPAALQVDGTYVVPDKYAYVSGDSDGEWNFVLAELSLFNRAEWAKTQPFLPGPGEDKASPTVPNPDYVAGYVPRYYTFGEGDNVPIYNLGDIYFDATTGTWVGDEEVPLSWNLDMLSVADPDDTANPLLYNLDGTPKAVVRQLTPTDGWITDWMYKLSIEYFEDSRVLYDPMRLDGLLYTNNAIFSLTHRISPMAGRMVVNGALVCADLGLLAPGFPNPSGVGTKNNPPGSPYATGLQLNYDRRVKDMLNVANPWQVKIKRTLWNPTANMM